MTEKLTLLSWDQLQKDTEILGQKLKEMGPFSGVIAVARGGLIPAAMIAHILNIRLIDSISVSLYDATQQNETLTLLRPIPDNSDGWLVVDDLVDSGNTYRALRKLLPKSCFAAIYAKPAGMDAADVFAVEKPQDRWIVFPWEKDVIKA